MRTPSLYWIPLVVVAAVAAESQGRADPERILVDQLQFTSAEVEQARAGQPVVKVRSDREELVVGGAIRLSGKKERLAEWLRNIEHFRNSAQLGTTNIIPAPPADAGFAGVNLDASDLAELRQCRADKCAIRLSTHALSRFQAMAWDAPDATAQANGIFRQMLAGYTAAYVSGGHTGLAAYDGPEGHASFADDMRQLIQRATAFTILAPALVGYLDGFPATRLPLVDEIFYWTAVPAGSARIVSVHHLVVYRPGASEVWIADKTIYASRYLDAGLLAIALYDAPDGAGYYAIAGSRIMASRLGGVAGTVLRRQVQRSAADTVKMYLEWVRDSLAQAGPAPH